MTNIITSFLVFQKIMLLISHEMLV